QAADAAAPRPEEGGSVLRLLYPQQWLRALQTWDDISTDERQVILSCCEGDPGGPAVFQRLQNRVSNPNLATLLQEHTLKGENSRQGAKGRKKEMKEKRRRITKRKIRMKEKKGRGRVDPRRPCCSALSAQRICPLCRRCSSTRNKAHPESKAAKKKRPQVSCDMCGRTFAHPSEHFEEKPFACEECGANSFLKNHMRLHTGE
ncbi:unnamed protein product, partial [Coregonus sp. 'balchen']